MPASGERLKMIWMIGATVGLPPSACSREASPQDTAGVLGVKAKAMGRGRVGVRVRIRARAREGQDPGKA